MALITVSSSAFSSPSLNNVLLDPTTLEYVRWQVAASASFVPPWVDTWFTLDYFDGYTYDVPPGAKLYFRVQYRDNLGVLSDWSEPFEYTAHSPSTSTSVVDVGGLYVASENAEGVLGWSKWALHESAEIVAIDAMGIPGRGPVLTLVVRRPSGVFIEHIRLTDTEA
jgi:hypothetical protein